MGGLSLTLEIAKKTLLNTQVEINTTTHNISNADTEGYSRQTAVQTANHATRTNGGWLGNGANVTSIVQSRDRFIEAQLMDAASNKSRYSALASQLASIQSTFSDNGSTGISQALGKFWDSWDTLSQNATGLSEQASVYSAADNLAEAIRTSYGQLNSYATDTIPSEIEDTVKEANSLIKQIADYNTAIMKSESSSTTANDLRDARYKALTELAALIPVDFTENENGIATLSTTDESGTEILLANGGKVVNEIAANSAISGGKLAGLRDALEKVNSYMDRLNSFAEQLITNVNDLHSRTSDGTNDGPEVFTAVGTDYAATITASTTFLSENSAEEASRAVALSQLQDAKVTFTYSDPEESTTATFGSFLAGLQELVGSDTDTAKTRQTYYGALATTLQEQQQSVSGVSLDEELVDIIKLQHIYQAAAKVIDATSSLLDTVVALGR